jgi:hypothetical protein
MSPRTARYSLRRLLRHFQTPIALSAEDYQKALDLAVEMGVSGGSMYDALHSQAGRKRGVEAVATYNFAHFVRFWPVAQLVAP